MASANTGNHLYIYVVDRDFGFAPNPFHGVCSLATCKPNIRGNAQVGDWVMGVGGRRLKAKGKCIYLMKVTEISNFNAYWEDSRFQIKKPQRNGSLIMMVGDNIYHQIKATGAWIQEDSHHSNEDGSPNLTNLARDTKKSQVLLSEHFYYFGKLAPNIDLSSINYNNGIGHRKLSINDENVATFLNTIEANNKGLLNYVQDVPIQFLDAEKRVDQGTGKIF